MTLAPVFEIWLPFFSIGTIVDLQNTVSRNEVDK